MCIDDDDGGGGDDDDDDDFYSAIFHSMIISTSHFANTTICLPDVENTKQQLHKTSAKRQP